MLFPKSGGASGGARKPPFRLLIAVARWLPAMVLLISVAAGAGASLTLAWDPSPSAEVTSYKIYYGASSGNYTNSVTVANTNRATINNLTGGVTYYFGAVAVASSGVESSLSNELMFTPAAVSTPVGLTLKLAMDTARQAILQAMAKPGKQYQVQASSDLKAWTTVANLTAAADGAVAYTDTTSKYFSRRFYRLLEPGAASLPPAGPVLTISLNPKREAMIRANATPGKAYALEASGDMKAWSVLANLTGADDLTVTYTDLTSKYFSRRYYRLRDN